jgi:4'-phosphopantetheinyl transferase
MKLRSNDIHLYLSWTGKITDDGLLDRYQSLLSNDELAQMARFHFARDRHQFLITRALIRTSLSNYFQVDPSRWQFARNSYGKPEIHHPDKALPVRFNISHSDGLVICGITRDCDIGVDVEDRQRTTRAALDGLSRYFSPQEIEDLRMLPEHEQKQRFFDYWTLKESYIKARGKGLAIPLDQFSFHFRKNSLVEFRVNPGLDDNAGDWQFWRFPVADRYQVAMAVKSPSADFKLTAFDTVPLHSNETIELTFS